MGNWWTLFKSMFSFSKLIATFFACLIVSSCAVYSPGTHKTTPSGLPQTTLTPFQPHSWTPLPDEATIMPATATSTLNTSSLWLSPDLPKEITKSIRSSSEYLLVDSPSGASIRVEVSSINPVSSWIYALAAPFPTILDDVPSTEIIAKWQGKDGHNLGGKPLLMEETTIKMLTAIWGAAGENAVKSLTDEKILDYAWDERDHFAIIPFEKLEPRWKVLQVDGISPLQKAFQKTNYALRVDISLNFDSSPPASSYINRLGILIPATNRDGEKMTTLALSGVTALVRATAWTMEIQGIDYPAIDISHILKNADITHISNEVAFAVDCPYPNSVQSDVVFCSADKYIDLMEIVGTDIVELTGDHLGDWGTEALLHTLDLYDQKGWKYYGGGRDLKAGRKAVLLEHNGNKLAFIGCNAKGSNFAKASDINPGAVTCDFSWMRQEINRVTEQGYLPIVTFQHFEYYTYYAMANQVRDGRAMTGSGAVIVSGSQAHHPQAIEFHNNGFIHYGLGNLFFDQFDISLGARQAFIDVHTFYNGKHINTELVTILFIDYARPRPMTSQEREDLLSSIFSASWW